MQRNKQRNSVSLYETTACMVIYSHDVEQTLTLYIDTRIFIKYNGFNKTVKRGVLMKLSRMEYTQLAIEKFTKVMKDIPFVAEVKISLSGLQRGFGDFHAEVSFVDDRDPIYFAVEVKANGEKRFANLFVKLASQHNDDKCYMFMAPYISESSAETILQNNFSYMDLSGNCYILSKYFVIHFSGHPNLYKDHRQKRDYFSKNATAASVVMRTMLDKPHACWKVSLLSELTGKALGTVFNVKKFLQEQDWIEEYQHGFSLKHEKEILYAWAKTYHLRPPRSMEYYSLDAIPKIEAEIQSCNSLYGTNTALGSFSAAARYAPVVRYNKVYVYVEQRNLETLVRELDLQPVSSGGNVIITIPHDGTPCMFTRTINGDLVTSPVQTIIDLLGHKGRGEEAAEAIIQKEFK